MDKLLATVQRIGEHALANCGAAQDPSISSRALRDAFIAAADAGELSKWSITHGAALAALDYSAHVREDGRMLAFDAETITCAIRALELRNVLESRDVVAQGFLGTKYLLGIDVRVDYDSAFQLLSLASRRGAMRALANLAWMYELGLGTAPDPFEAARLYERAARAGDFHSQIALGRLYSSGAAVPVDRERARHWYLLAVAQEGAIADCDELHEARAFLASPP